MLRTLVAPVSCVLCLWSAPSFAARTIPLDKAIVLRLELSQPTVVVFPEHIASVYAAMPLNHFSLEMDGPYLIVKPFEATVAGRMFATGKSGKLYLLTFQVTTPSDDVVHLTVPASVLAKTQTLSVGSMVRALRTGTPLPGQTLTDVAAPAIADTRLAVLETHAITVGAWIGLVLTVRNTQQQPLALDLRLGEPPGDAQDGIVLLQTWVLPPRLTVRAVAADVEMLDPDGQTRIYLVCERRL